MRAKMRDFMKIAIATKDWQTVSSGWRNRVIRKDIILPITYIVVLFSILVQGLTFQPALPLLLRLP